MGPLDIFAMLGTFVGAFKLFIGSTLMGFAITVPCITSLWPSPLRVPGRPNLFASASWKQAGNNTAQPRITFIFGDLTLYPDFSGLPCKPLMLVGRRRR